jgi:RNA polymerase sigma-70 factor, ECF subfamily
MTGAEEARWIELYREWEKPLYNVVYRVLWDADESQDVVQEAFLRCWRHRDRVRGDGLKPLVFRTALNLASNRRRRARLWRMVGLAEVAELTDEHANGEPLSKPVREAFDALPERFRRVLLLTEIAGMTYAETAAALGTREGTIGSRRTRALAMLRERFEAQRGDENHRDATHRDATPIRMIGDSDD